MLKLKMCLLKTMPFTTYYFRRHIIIGKISAVKFKINFEGNKRHFKSTTTAADDTEADIITSSMVSNKMDTARKADSFMIVGLGNQPFPETRHSVGMQAVDQLAIRLGLHWEKSQGRLGLGGLLCKTVINLRKTSDVCMAEIYLFKPKALMNINGGSVARTAKLLGMTADQIYLVHDELDMAVGKWGLKLGGSAKGHKGVQSCVLSLKSSGLWVKESSTDTRNLPRLRLGIGRPSSKSEVVSYVLNRVPSEDLKAIATATDKGFDLLLKHIAGKVTETQKDQTDET